MSVPTTPLDYYRNHCTAGSIVEDQEQLRVLQSLQTLYDQLLLEQKKRTGVLALLHHPKLLQGLYIWGGVGIGKTFLMDCFFHCIPFPQKMRMHFHSFMRWVHQQLKDHQGEKNPLQIIAKDLAKKTIILCFDELFVDDIADAMLIGRLFTALSANGLCLVATSNVPPDDLYKKGLQRSQFLPAIALIKRVTQVIHVASAVDYRLRHLKDAGVFYTPNDAAANEKMEKAFTVLANQNPISTAPIEICGRLIPVHKHTGQIVWFDFKAICTVPRSQQDYLMIAEKFHTVFISDIPVIPPTAKDMIYLFISLVDIFYDAHVRLVFSAAEPVEKIYDEGYMVMEYMRTHSRLLEMQSEDYFATEV